MEKNFIIGNSTVRIDNAGRLAGAFAGLLRLPQHDGVPIDASLEIVARPSPDWPLDVTRQGDVHCFGRPTYAFEVEPREHRLRLLLTAMAGADGLYWFQRDIFGILACMAGDLMLHGSAVTTPHENAWVFCGPSQAGKSTICRMLISAGFPAINDEVNWLFLDETGALRIVNQPFWFGKAGAPVLPVDRLCLLRQGSRCSFQPPYPRSETFARLLAGHLSIDTRYDFLKNRADTLKRLVETHTIDVLEFNLDTEELVNLLWKKARPNNS